MNTKIKNYVDVLFGDIPRSKKALELKEEILSNLSERYDEYISQGKSENQAYTMAVSNMGDIDELIADVMPDEGFRKEANNYRRRNAKNTAIAVSMYIIGAAFFLGLAEYGEFIGNEEFYDMVGLLILLLISAVATGIIIYSNMSTPVEFKNYDGVKMTTEVMADNKIYTGSKGSIYKGIMSIFWSIVTLVYLVISFFTGAWGISWIIWVIAAILSGIIEVIMEMRALHE